MKNKKNNCKLIFLFLCCESLFCCRMKRLLCCIFLMFVSCNNNQITNPMSASQYNSSSNPVKPISAMYDAYKPNTSIKGLNVSHAQPMQYSDQPPVCLTSCVKKTLHISILPMTASSPTVITEIQNALTMVKFTGNYEKYTVNIIEGTDFALRSLQSTVQDIIVGPFNEKDVIAVQHQVGTSGVKTPIASLASKNLSGGGLYNFGYRAEVGVMSIIDFAKNRGYKTLAMLSSNNEIGGSNYKMFSSIAKQNKIDVLSVEFYEPNVEDVSKYISRLKSAAVQAYYQNIRTSKIQKDDFNFTKDIIATEGEIVTHVSGEKFHKQHVRIDAIILDTSSKDFFKIYSAIASDSILSQIPLIGSPRVADGIIEMLISGGESISQEIFFPSNFETYRDYYEVYKNTFNQSPTRFSATIYETIQYLLTVHQVQEIDAMRGVAMSKISTIDGVNGKMVPDIDGRTIRRIVDIYSFKDGVVKRVDSQVDRLENPPIMQ